MNNSESTQFKAIYTLNEEYFKNINTENKAYWLGFLYADGCISEKRNGVCLSLQEEDKEILEKFNKDLESNRPIPTYKPSSKFPYRKNMSQLNIVNKYFYKHLIDKGCFANKSLILEFPTDLQVPKELVRHFIRGYFDGDGSVYISSKKLSVELIGTPEFISVCQSILMNEVGLNKTTLYAKKNTKNTVRMRYSGTRQCIKIFKYLYEDSSVFLERKYNKFLDKCPSI